MKNSICVYMSVCMCVLDFDLLVSLVVSIFPLSFPLNLFAFVFSSLINFSVVVACQLFVYCHQ